MHVALFILCYTSANRSPLESDFGSHRPQTSHSDRLVRSVHLNVLFWPVQNLYGTRTKVRSFHSYSVYLPTHALPFSRALNGALNGNIGVIKSMMVEITDSTNLAQAYAYMPIAWSSGGTLGYVPLQYFSSLLGLRSFRSPLIGGSLSRPADRFPNLFGHSQFLKTYPYFLPCAVPATFSALAWIVTFFFLREVRYFELSCDLCSHEGGN
jgi:hypothetical protein